MAEEHDRLMEISPNCPRCRVGKLQIPEDLHPSYCVCDTCDIIHLTYMPQDYQEEFHRTPYLYNHDGTLKIQTIGLFGGYGSAKSTASLWEFFIRALENPNGVGLLTAPTLQLLKRTSIKTLLDEIIPPPLLQHYNKTEGEMLLENGFAIWTIPSDDEEKLRSINAGIVHMEEASGIKRSIYDQLLTRTRNKRTKNRVILVCSNPDLGWIKDVIVDNNDRKAETHPAHEDYDDTTSCYIWESSLNKYLPTDFIAKQSKGKPDWWIQRFLKGSFKHSSGMVYPKFIDCIIDDIPDFDKKSKGWDKFVSLDHGLRNPTAVPFGALDPKEGIVYIYQEYYQAEKLIPHHANAIKPLINEIPPGRLRFMVADPSIRNKTDPVNGKSVQGLYQEYNLYFSEGNNDIVTGILRLNSYIERGRIKVFKSCFNLTREMLGYKYPELSMDDEKDPDEKPIKRADHMPDALRYMFMRLPEDPDMLKSPSYADVDHSRPKKDYDVEDDDDEQDVDSDNYLSYV